MKKGIEYADKSWNPYSGCRAVNDYNLCALGTNCWAFKRARMLGNNPAVKGYTMPDPFKPTFHKDKLDIPLKRKIPTRWDTCFMGDIAYAEKEWLEQILDVVKRCPQHRFYFLTKQPDELAKKDLIFPDNAWVGVTINREEDTWRIDQLLEIHCGHTWVSAEPVYDNMNPCLYGIDWLVIGAQSNPEVQPEKGWIEDILAHADNISIPVFIKPNLTVVDPRMKLPKELVI